MKLISLLIALLLIGLLVNKQLNSSSSQKQLEELTDIEDVDVPKVPSSPEDINKFEDEINEFVLDSADKRAKKFEENLGN